MIVSDPAKRRLKVDQDSLLAALLYVMNRAPGLTQYQVLKALFLSDRAHLNRWGRPITFDNYVAMDYGPVASRAYDLLKPDKTYTRFMSERPWVWKESAKNERYYYASKEPDYNLLAETDMEELDAAISTVSTLDFDELKALTHNDKAWAIAWHSRKNKAVKSEPMRFSLLMDNGDGDRLEDQLVYASHHS